MSDYINGVKIFKNDYDEGNKFRPYRMRHTETPSWDGWDVIDQNGTAVACFKGRMQAAGIRNIMNDQVEPLLRKIYELEQVSGSLIDDEGD